MSSVVRVGLCHGCGWVDLPWRVTCSRCSGALTGVRICGHPDQGPRSCPGLVRDDEARCQLCGEEVPRD